MFWPRRVAAAVSAMVFTGALGACTVPPRMNPEQIAMCRTERETIETALEAGFVTNGSFPPSIEAMQGELYLLEPGSLSFDWDYETDGASYALGGRC